ncbi:acyl carrier protein phosphodiesterase [Spirosoma pomorum]
MNILAHACLSAHNDDWLIGNFIGDFIKGNPASERHGLEPGIVAGVRLHRSIDTFTDDHPDVAAVRELLYPRCHKYAGVAVDVFFDHFLATQFSALTGEELSAFITYVYRTLQQNSARLPTNAVKMLNAMVRYDWLASYQTLEGIDRSLTGISRRTAYPSGLDTAIVDLEQHYDFISEQFNHFWPQLTAHVHDVGHQL